MCFFDEFEEEIVTTTTKEGYVIVGDLKRQEENGQFFVIDPVDSKKTFVNSHDDMYEDAADKVWKLI